MPARLHFPELRQRPATTVEARRARQARPNVGSGVTFVITALPLGMKLRQGHQPKLLMAFGAGMLLVLGLCLRAITAPQEYYPDPSRPEGALPAPHSWRVANLATMIGTGVCLLAMALFY